MAWLSPGLERTFLDLLVNYNLLAFHPHIPLANVASNESQVSDCTHRNVASLPKAARPLDQLSRRDTVCLVATKALTPQGRTVAKSVHREVILHEHCSPGSLDGNYGIYRIPSDRPGVANFQQPLNYGGMPWSSRGIPPRYHVHSPPEATTETCLSYIFHCTTLPELGHIRRKPRLTSEAAALILNEED
jgi:hypothetical protein